MGTKNRSLWNPWMFLVKPNPITGKRDNYNILLIVKLCIILCDK